MLCFRKVPVAKKFMDQRRGGEYQAFPSKIFCLTVLTKSVGKPFCAAFQKISARAKIMNQRGGVGGVSRFSVENFLSHSAEVFRRGIL